MSDSSSTWSHSGRALGGVAREDPVKVRASYLSRVGADSREPFEQPP